jgi:Ca2+-binding EF-hand superfamily protein/CRP-like cAMP-binding protein
MDGASPPPPPSPPDAASADGSADGPRQPAAPDILPGTPTLELPEVRPSPRPSPRLSVLGRTATAPGTGTPSRENRMVSFSDDPTGQNQTLGQKLQRSTTLATVVNGRDPTWPDWLAVAKDRFPVLLPAEIVSLHEMFHRHAVAHGLSGELSITLSGVGEILDEGFRDLFNQLDADQSGSLERDEIAALVSNLGRQFSSSELNAMMKQLDADGSGDVDFEEFREWWDQQQFHSAEEREMELRDLFDIVDTDSSGEIDWEEFLTMIGGQLSRDKSFATPRERKEPAAAGMLVRTALECVRADVRAIYGTNTRGKTRLRVLNQTEMEAQRRRCFFTPESTFRKSWDLMQALMLFYVALAVPLRIGFDRTAKLHSFMFYFEMLVDCYFYTDIFVQFRSAYFTIDKELIIDLKLIRRTYMRTWFPIDLLSCLPVNYIELGIKYSKGEQDAGTDQKVKLFKILRLLRLAKLLRLARINRLLQRLEQEYDGLAAALKVQKICLTIIFVAHVVACFWYFVGTEEKMEDGETTLETHPDEDQGVKLYKVFGAGDSISNPGAVLEGWVVKNGWHLDPDFQKVSLWTRYLDSFYFSVTTLTTVGFGDRTPFTNTEKVFSILAELAGSIIFGIIAGSMGALAMSTKMSEREMKFERERLDEFLKLKRISKDLRKKVSEQMDNWFDQKSVFDEQAILDKLPPKHRKELLMEMYRDHLSTCPLLKGMEEGILSKLCLKMSPYLALRDDLIVKEGEVGEEMYMVVRGCIRLSSENWRLYNERSWEDGAFFGELTVLGIGAGPEANRHVYSATAYVDSDCIFISQRALQDLQLNHPTFKHKMRSMAIKRAQRFGYGERYAYGEADGELLLPESPLAGAGYSGVGTDAGVAGVAGAAPNPVGTPAVDAVRELDSSMSVALDTAERRSRVTSGIGSPNGPREPQGRESRQFLNLPSGRSSKGGQSPMDASDRSRSSQLKQELLTDLSISRSPSSQSQPHVGGSGSGGGSDGGGNDVREEVSLLRQEVSMLSQLLRESLQQQQRPSAAASSRPLAIV